MIVPRRPRPFRHYGSPKSPTITRNLGIIACLVMFIGLVLIALVK